MTILAPVSIGSEIRTVRKEQKITQTQLAALVGCDQRELSNYESGKTLPSLERLEKIAEVLGKEWRLK